MQLTTFLQLNTVNSLNTAIPLTMVFSVTKIIFIDKEILMVPIEEPKNDVGQTDNDLRRHKFIACTVGLCKGHSLTSIIIIIIIIIINQ
jgi:hypothetical protein